MLSARLYVRAIAAAILVMATVASPAAADFVVTNTGPLNSAGPVGDSDNAILNATYSGSTTVFTRAAFSGRLTKVASDTRISDARFQVSSTQTTFNLIPGAPSGFSGSVNVSRTTHGLYWMDSGENFQLESFDGDNNGPGPDATWSDISITFRNEIDPYAIGNDLGTFLPGTFNFNTNGSTGDTKIAIYDAADGRRLGQDDNSGNGVDSQLARTLDDGHYLFLVGSDNSRFSHRAAIAGLGSGDIRVRLNGTLVSERSFASGRFAIYSFTVTTPPAVPAPAALPAGLALLGLINLRRKYRNA